MDFPYPDKNQITVYSKSGCIYCTKVNTLLKNMGKPFNIINCDEFILNNKEEFLSFMQKLIGKEYKMFPMVFNCNTFIGGFNETNIYVSNLQQQMLDFDMLF